MVKVIAFDFGDVLVKDTVKAIERKFWTRKVSPAAGQKFLRVLHAVETGKGTERDMIHAIHEYLVPQWSEAKIHNHILTARLLPPWRLLQQVSKKYPVAILTNNYKSGPPWFGKRLGIDLSPYTIVNSSHIGVRKPHINFYKAALKRLKVKPDEILFIDDIARNVTGARKAGIRSFRYNRNMPQLREFLAKNGVKL